MHKLGRGHRDKIQQFITITGASEKVALQALKASEWHLEGAFDLFYSQPQIRTFTDARHLEELYNRYKDQYSDMIMADGITLLCNDLQVDPQDIVMLVLSWHMKASTMCEFSKQEFIGGLQALGVDSLEKLRERIPSMRSELKDEQKFREIYNFAFGWAKEKGMVPVEFISSKNRPAALTSIAKLRPYNLKIGKLSSKKKRNMPWLYSTTRNLYLRNQVLHPAYALSKDPLVALKPNVTIRLSDSGSLNEPPERLAQIFSIYSSSMICLSFGIGIRPLAAAGMATTRR